MVLQCVGLNKTSPDNGGIDIRMSSSKVESVSMPSNSETKGEIIMKSTNLKSFSFSGLKEATINFCPDSFLGAGNFGCVYKGWIDEHSLEAVKPETGMAIAVKMLNQKGCQGQQEWLVSTASAVLQFMIYMFLQLSTLNL